MLLFGKPRSVGFLQRAIISGDNPVLPHHYEGRGGADIEAVITGSDHRTVQ